MLVKRYKIKNSLNVCENVIVVENNWKNALKNMNKLETII